MDEGEEIIEDFKTRACIQIFIGNLPNEQCHEIANKLKEVEDMEIDQHFDEDKRLELCMKISERKVELKGSETFKERFHIYLDGICENAVLSEDIIQQLNQYAPDFLDITDESCEEWKDSPLPSERYPRREYPMARIPRGTCIIINNTFKHNEKLHRTGTDADRDRLKSLFEWLDFEVVVRNDMNANEMHELFNKLGDNILEHSDCFVCCILSHGSSSDIYGNDDKPVSRQILTKSVQTKVGKKLENKPKIFFLQACRKELDQEASEDPPPAFQDSRAPASDICVVAATTEDTYAYRESASAGSFFIQTVCGVFEEYADKEPFKDMIERVNNTLSEKRIPYVNPYGEFKRDHQMPDKVMETLCGKLHFNPRISFKDYCKKKSIDHL